MASTFCAGRGGAVLGIAGGRMAAVICSTAECGSGRLGGVGRFTALEEATAAGVGVKGGAGAAGGEASAISSPLLRSSRSQSSDSMPTGGGPESVRQTAETRPAGGSRVAKAVGVGVGLTGAARLAEKAAVVGQMGRPSSSL